MSVEQLLNMAPNQVVARKMTAVSSECAPTATIRSPLFTPLEYMALESWAVNVRSSPQVTCRLTELPSCIAVMAILSSSLLRTERVYGEVQSRVHK